MQIETNESMEMSRESITNIERNKSQDLTNPNNAESANDSAIQLSINIYFIATYESRDIVNN